MKILSEVQKDWLRRAPVWNDIDEANGEAIIARCTQVENEYEFDVNIPMAEQREHIERLQESLQFYEAAGTAVAKPNLKLKLIPKVEVVESPFDYPELEKIGTWQNEGGYNFVLSLGLAVFLVLSGIALVLVALAYVT